MKVDKKLFISIGIAAGVALVLLLVLLILSLIGWGFIYAILVMLLIPFAYAGTQFWEEHDCLDFEDFWDELTTERKSKQSENTTSIIDDSDYHRDWY